MEGVIKTRDRYIDSLRAAALVRVVTYHAFSWIWLPYVFPSMGIMFALAGSLMASSLDRATGLGPLAGVILRRMRRLLLPLWALGAVLIPAMLLIGWSADEFGVPFSFDSLWLWILPIGDPLGSDWGSFAGVGSLWYLRAYLWFVLLSPALYWAFRRMPVTTTIAVPVIAWTVSVIISESDAFQQAGSGDLILRLSDESSSIAVYGGCWMLGFAHHTGMLRRLWTPFAVPLAVLLMALGTAYAFSYPHPTDGVAIDVIAPAQTLYCFGAVLLLLRFNPSFDWLDRVPFVDQLINAVNGRAVTIYLWNSAAVLLAGTIVSQLYEDVPESLQPLVLEPTYYILTWVFVGIAVLALGWVEDIAARRTPRFIPPGLIKESAYAHRGSRGASADKVPGHPVARTGGQ